MEKDYYLGLDMGTDSVGWAVTDENYNLIRAKGKDLWGVREFDSAKPAADRRSYRISRRRRQREQVRLGMLKSIFADAIKEKDPLFFIRLENSKYWKDDKNSKINTKNVLFDDPGYTDADYFKEFPTIFHLRLKLMNDDSGRYLSDPRFVYLACLQLFKHRGHFLSDISDETDPSDLSSTYERFKSLYCELTGYEFTEKDVAADDIMNVLSDRNLSRTAKKEKLIDVFSFSKSDSSKTECLKSICGLESDACKIFPDLKTEDIKKLSFNFSKSDYEEKSAELNESVGDEYFELISILKDIYDKGTLADILKGKKYLSEARVEDYNKHKKDLVLLKSVYRKYKTQDEYNEMFRDPTKGYGAYIGSNFTKDKKTSRRGSKSRDVFYDYLKKSLKGLEEDPDVKTIFDDIAKENFLVKQLTSSNGVIPNQVHLKELKKILSNAENYLPFLKETDESGLSASQRIISIFSFTIPYYVGPVSELSEKNGGNGWVVRKEDGKVYPWNFEDKINISETKRRFIDRLINECTYISGEKVLPKQSLIYQKFAMLNELNSVRINGERLDVEFKQKAFKELFSKGKQVTLNEFKNYLNNNGINIDEKSEISGVGKSSEMTRFNNKLSSYQVFHSVFGDKLEDKKYYDAAENIIYLGTIYADDKKTFKKAIEEKYGDFLTPDEIKRVSGLKFKDWGTLSAALFNLQGAEKSTGEVMTLIDALWNTQLNFMELINSDAFSYKEELEKYKKKGEGTIQNFKFEELNDYYFSAPVKRMIWQTVLIVREIEHVLGKPPVKMFVEVTRHDEEKEKIPPSRKDTFLSLYKNIKDESHDWKAIIEKADESGVIRSQKMYLYLSQMGRDLYTGKEIELDELFTTKYDIDHIIPQSLKKDDSILNNKVLTSKDFNNNIKQDNPLCEAIDDAHYAERKKLWDRLHNYNLINDEKYKRLTNRKGFSEEDLEGFIARQIVETSQAVLGVINIFKEIMPDTKIVFSKAKPVSDFRKNEIGWLKSRTLNDYHHAHDAYLNIVVGNVYNTKFTDNPRNFIKKERQKDLNPNYHMNKVFWYNVERGGKVAWIAGEDGTKKTVLKTLAKNSELMTRQSFEQTGGLCNQQITNKDDAGSGIGYLPVKMGEDISKYGGYAKISQSYFFLVEHTFKKKRIRTIETVPAYLKSQIESDPDALKRYCAEKLGLVDPDIRLRRINYQSLAKYNGFYVTICSKTGVRFNIANAVRLTLPKEWNNYIKKLEKTEGDEEITEEKNIELYDILTDKHLNSIFLKRPNPVGENLKNGREKFVSLSKKEQVSTLNNILLFTGFASAGKADISSIGGSKNAGAMSVSKNVNNADEFILIENSVTGIYSVRKDLKTI